MDHSVAGRLRSIEQCNDLNWNRTRDLPACRVVFQPTTLQHAPIIIIIIIIIIKSDRECAPRSSSIQIRSVFSLQSVVTHEYCD
jgi:hypothetical protein